MNFLLVRHADAQPLEGTADMTDTERPLTDKGIRQCQTLAEALQRAGVSLGQVVTSPLLRAKQTIEEVLRHWPEPKPEVHICDFLAPDGKEKKLSRFLRGLE